MYGLNVKADGRATDDGSEVDVRLKIDWDDAQPVRPFELEVEVLGSFHWSEPTPDQIREGWTDFNGLYLVWPYLRTYVHTVTALSSLEPLVLPTLAVPKQAAVGTADFEALQAESADH